MSHTKTIKKLLNIVLVVSVLGVLVSPGVIYAGTQCGDSPGVKTTIDLGCSGKGNPIEDMAFGIIRFLSDGVGLVITGSIVLGGIQYTTSAGDPQAVQKAIARIRSSVIALLLFLFAYPILNYLIPKGFLK